MKLLRRIQWIIFIIFMLGIYLGFVYTLSMLTEVTTLNYFSEFLDPSVVVYIVETQVINQLLFKLSLWLIVLSVPFFGFKFRKQLLGFKKLIFAFVIGIVSIILNMVSYNKMIMLNELYANTDTVWPARIPDIFGYLEPKNLYVGSGPMIYLVIMGISILFTLMLLCVSIVRLKEKKNEKTR